MKFCRQQKRIKISFNEMDNILHNIAQHIYIYTAILIFVYKQPSEHWQHEEKVLPFNVVTDNNK